MKNKQYFPAGRTIFREGDAPGNIYLVIKGKVQLVKNAGPNQTVLESIGRNGVFGEMSMFDRQPRSASAVAMEDTDCYTLNHIEFQEHLDNTNPFIRGVLRIMVDRLRSTTAGYTAALAGVKEKKK